MPALSENEIKIKNSFMELHREKLINGNLKLDDIPEKIQELIRAADCEDDEEVDVYNIRNQIERESATFIVDDGVVIVNNKSNHKKWFKPEMKKDFSLWNRYEKYFQNEVSFKEAEELNKSTDDILSNLDDPKRKDPWDRRGIVVGRVQGGKTANYIGLINKAIDAGCPLVVVLAGRNNDLRKQTQERIDEGLIGIDSSIDSEKKKIGVGLIYIENNEPKDINTITTAKIDGDFKRNVAQNFKVAPNKDPLILVVKKWVSILDNIITWIKSSLRDKDRKRVNHVPLLLIDDESDEASIDTTPRGVSRDEENRPSPVDNESDPTQTNRRIREILNLFDRSAYIAYSATPFANVFIYDEPNPDVHESHSYGEDLFPRDFVVTIPISSSYIGWDELDNEEASCISDHIIDFVNDPNDVNNRTASIGWMPPRHRSLHEPKFQNEDVIPPSLEKAIQSFLIAMAIGKLRKQKYENTMLVHGSRFVMPQGIVFEQILRYIRENLKASFTATMDYTTTKYYKEMKKLWDDDFKKKLNKEKEENFSFEDIIQTIRDQLSKEKIQVIQLNGNARGSLDDEDNFREQIRLDQYLKEKNHVIIIGGDKLSRGLTLKGLKTSYFLRHSSTITKDTFIQMARWFGYHKDYLDTIRIFLKREMYNNYCAMSETINDAMDGFSALKDKTPRDVQIYIRNHPGMQITSPSKSRYVTRVETNYSPFRTGTTNCLYLKDESIVKNINVFKNLINNLEEIKSENRGANILWSLKDPDIIYNFFQKYDLDKSAQNIFQPERIITFLKKQTRPLFKNWKILLRQSKSNKEAGNYKINEQKIFNCIKRSTRKDPTDTTELENETIYRIRNVMSLGDEFYDLNEWKNLRSNPPDGNTVIESQNIRFAEGHCSLFIYLLRKPNDVGEIDETTMPFVASQLFIPTQPGCESVEYTVTSPGL